MIQAEQHLRLLVEHRLGRVHVLAQVVVVEKLPRTETDDVAADVADRPQQPPVESVHRPLAPHPRQARLLQLVEGKAQPLQVLGQRVPTGRRIPAAELLGLLHGEPAVGEERPRRLRIGLAQLHGIELLRLTVGGDEPLARARLLPPAGAAALVIDAVTDLLGARLHGLGERQVLHLHEEAEDVPALARRKAVVVTVIGPHVEAGRALVFERRQPLHRIRATRLELDVLRDDLLDRRTFADRRDVAVGDASSCHGTTLAARPPCHLGGRATPRGRQGARSSRAGRGTDCFATPPHMRN